MADRDTDNEQNNTRWTSAEEEILISGLERAREDGLQADSGWKPCVWQRIIDLLIASGYNPKTIQQCKNRWQRFKKEYSELRRLRNLSGFGWDDLRQMVTASTDVWENMRGTNKSLCAWRKKSFPHFDRLAALIEGVVATGADAFRPGTLDSGGNGVAQAVNNNNDDFTVKPYSQTPVKPATSTSIPTSVLLPFAASPFNITPASSSGPSSTSNSIKREASFDESMHASSSKRKGKGRDTGVDALFALSSSLNGIAGAYTDESHAYSSQSEPRRQQAAISAVEDEEDLSDTELVDVAEMFRSDTTVADMYLAIKKPSARTKYLQKMLEKTYGAY